MTTRPEGKTLKILEQIIEDPVSGLTFQFEAMDGDKLKMKIFGDFPFGNREFIFDSNGKEAGAGVALTGLCRATWIKETTP